ncbi:MFS transporter [Frondihabitans australicus]|uniref:EmrB/QacA subfamily drug resistance transporter n=1 Tax=Frondihabitans australicus TaxID=386892 RepID=A0A495IGN0_9MICO|nr:MFS transporter [Frondihabitans australicus]RKR74578.1 EmrB/QacA subfamily drug resistance transporter [Frondihabitans australicus]
MTTPTTRQRAGAGLRSQALALLVAGCFFMENLDSTIVTTAVPSIARDLGVDAASVGVAITAYVMTVAILIPVSGWLADRFGSRTILVTAIALFTLASVACAASPTLSVLVLARIVQGIGGAMMVPVGRMTVLRATSKENLIRAVAVLTWPALVAPILAPFVGGLLTTYASWHWIFLVNVPLGAIGLVAALRIVPGRTVAHPDGTADSVVPEPTPPDWLGLALTSVGIAALVWATTLLTITPVDVVQTIVSAVVGLVLVGLAIRHLLRTPRPFVDLRLLRIHTYKVSVGGGSIYRLVISAVPFVVPLLLQRAFGWTPVQAGAAVLFLFAGNLGIKPATTWMLRTFGFRRLIVAAHVVGVACLVGMAFFRPSTPFAVMVIVLIVSGAARSTGFTAYNTITYADVEQAQMTGANVLDSTVQQIAIGSGIALGAVAISVGLSIVGAGDSPGSGMTAGYDIAFGVLAAILLVDLIPAWRLAPSAGSGLTARR